MNNVIIYGEDEYLIILQNVEWMKLVRILADYETASKIKQE
jgi:hypothetical protein